MSGEANSKETAKIHPLNEIVFWLVCAVVIGIYAWSAEPGALELVSSRPQDAYYNLLVQGFQSGQLNVKRDPAPGLAKLANPYDPAANTPLVWDTRHLAYEMSYYKGKLYLYFGITPALVLFWPYVTLTGHYLDHKNAAVIFFALGFLVAAGLLRAICRRYFPQANIWTATAGVLALGLASGILEMLSSCDVYEVAKSCAFAFSMLALAAIWRALHDPKAQIKYVAFASFAYGLAIGARPSLLFGAILLLVPVAFAWRAAGPRPRRILFLLTVAAVAPVTLIISGLMLYNDLRFDNPLEFGWHYQLTSFQNHGATQFSLSYLWYNLRFYFLHPMHWTWQFPFLKSVQILPSPSGYNGTGPGYSGILADYPILWLALAAPLAWRGTTNETLRRFASVLFLLFLSSAATLCLFFASSSSYESDFLPPLVLLSAMGVFGVEYALRGFPVWRRLVRGGWTLLLVFSLVVNALAAVEAHATSRYFDGDFLLSEGRLTEAALQFRKALAIWPEYAGAWCGMGTVFLQQGQLDQAIFHYQKAIEFDPSLPEAVNNLGYCYYKAGRLDDAMAQYERVLKIQPDYAQARNNLADCLLRKHQTDDAIFQYQKSVELDPDSATYQCGLGNAFLQKGLLDQAIAQYQKAIELQPDFGAAYNYLAYCLFRQGRFGDAIVQYRQAIQLEPQSAIFHSDLANALLQGGKPDDAIAEFQKALALQPESADVHKRLGDALFQKGQLNAAIVQYQKATELEPNFPEALNNLGYCFLLAGRLDDAIDRFQKLTALQPDFAPAYNSLGSAWCRKGKPSQAIAAFEKAIKLQPDFVSAQKNLAWVLATSPDASIRNGTRAVALASHANQLAGGEDPGVLRTLAAAYAETGRFAEALSTAQKALAIAKSDKDLTVKLQVDIKLYQNHFPCRDD